MIPCYNLVNPLVTFDRLLEEDLNSCLRFSMEVCHDKIELLRDFVKEFNAFKALAGLGNQWIEEAYYTDMDPEFVPIVAKMCKIKNLVHISKAKEELIEFSTNRTYRRCNC